MFFFFILLKVGEGYRTDRNPKNHDALPQTFVHSRCVPICPSSDRRHFGLQVHGIGVSDGYTKSVRTAQLLLAQTVVLLDQNAVCSMHYVGRN
jgi:hypothetical protein